MRLFVAVLPPVSAVQELVDAVAPLRSAAEAERLRWSAVEGWHLTLAFLGELPVTEVPAVEELLGRVAAGHGAHRLRLAGGGCFGDRVLWAGVEGEVWALRRLAEAVRAGVGELGVETDQFGFHPHLTLARAGSTHGQRRAERRAAAGGLQRLAEQLAEYRGEEWEAAELHLVRSETGSGPSRYTTLRSWPLARWSEG
ncbi:Putative 2'-5' RNA ligase [Kitasatospora sp. MMS16-BH015]|uniref:RNA 2',3'-cyclic phosphodiesterase n=1 Tax=Kitasatospora sp. MMS16-BH015 TaxID=2018025 RepID=UPI000CA0FFDB|nr:RNA 2',3'-cyclic phosphodiesterase [Kitasatospora sp. MMS16-BH015]AUG79170.1 Putative 2'-5' RNA ligase [Kitasatospora sp. MMS16-BH015]